MIQVLPCYSDFNSTWSVTLLLRFLFLHIHSHHDWQEGSNKERWYVWGHAAGCSGLCHTGHGEVQYWERHRCIYQKGHPQNVYDWHFHRLLKQYFIFEISFLIVSCFLEIFSEAVSKCSDLELLFDLKQIFILFLFINIPTNVADALQYFEANVQLNV